MLRYSWKTILQLLSITIIIQDTIGDNYIKLNIKMINKESY